MERKIRNTKQKNKSPDAAKVTTKSTPIQLGDVLKKQYRGYTVASTPSNLKMVIKRKLPPKPRLTTTTLTFWKPVFDNRHYHISNQCVMARNPAFRGKEVVIALTNCEIQGDMKQFLSSRLDL